MSNTLVNKFAERIIDLRTEGKTNSEISRELGISKNSLAYVLAQLISSGAIEKRNTFKRKLVVKTTAKEPFGPLRFVKQANKNENSYESYAQKFGVSTEQTIFIIQQLAKMDTGDFLNKVETFKGLLEKKGGGVE